MQKAVMKKSERILEDAQMFDRRNTDRSGFVVIESVVPCVRRSYERDWKGSFRREASLRGLDRKAR